MGKSLLVAIGLALTLSSLIPVDSSDKIIAPRYLTRITFDLQNHSKCEFKSSIPIKSDQNYFTLEIVSQFLTYINVSFV
jgi:hypothetical protein